MRPSLEKIFGREEIRPSLEEIFETKDKGFDLSIIPEAVSKFFTFKPEEPTSPLIGFKKGEIPTGEVSLEPPERVKKAITVSKALMKAGQEIYPPLGTAISFLKGAAPVFKGLYPEESPKGKELESTIAEMGGKLAGLLALQSAGLGFVPSLATMRLEEELGTGKPELARFAKGVVLEDIPTGLIFGAAQVAGKAFAGSRDAQLATAKALKYLEEKIGKPISKDVAERVFSGLTRLSQGLAAGGTTLAVTGGDIKNAAVNAVFGALQTPPPREKFLVFTPAQPKLLPPVETPPVETTPIKPQPETSFGKVGEVVKHQGMLEEIRNLQKITKEIENLQNWLASRPAPYRPEIPTETLPSPVESPTKTSPSPIKSEVSPLPAKPEEPKEFIVTKTGRIIPKPEISPVERSKMLIAQTLEGLSPKAIEMIEQEVKRIDKQLLEAKGTGIRARKETGEWYGIKSLRPEDLKNKAITKALKYKIARNRLENGYKDATGLQDPPDIDFLIEIGELEKARELDKVFPVLTPDELSFYRKVLELQKELGLSPDDKDIIIAKEAIERYEKRRKALYGEEVPPVSPAIQVEEPSVIPPSETTPTLQEGIAQKVDIEKPKEEILKPAFGPDYEAERKAIEARKKRLEALAKKQAEIEAKRQTEPLKEEEVPLLAGLPGMQPSLFKPKEEITPVEAIVSYATEKLKVPETYEGLTPGTPEWMTYWKAHPEQQEEMLAYQRRLAKKLPIEEMTYRKEEIPEESYETKEESLTETLPQVPKISEWEELDRAPKEGEYLKANYKGKEYEGKITKIVRVPSGAVLAYGTWGKEGIPVTKYATWYKPVEITPLGTRGAFAAVGEVPEYKPPKEETPTQPEFKPHIEMPEMVKLTTELLGKPPIVAKLKKSYGYFKHGKTLTEAEIKLREDIFKNPVFAGKILSHEIGHLVDWLPDYVTSRGNILGRLLTLRKFLKATFGELSNKEIRQELKDLTNYWNPIPEGASKSYLAYRYSSSELYAEAVSVLLNAPEELEKRAPKFYRAFFDNLDKKPEVKQALEELETFLKLGEDAKLLQREADILDMFRKGEEIYYEKRNRYKFSKRNIGFRLRTELIDKNQPLIDLVKEVEKERGKFSPEDNPLYYLEDWNYIGGKVTNLLEDVQQKVIEPLLNKNIDTDIFGEYLFLNRVVTERADIANPLGQNRETAKRQLEFLKSRLGEDKFFALEKGNEEFQKIMKQLLDEALGVGLIKPEIYKQIITNPAYATFQVLDYLDTYVSPTIIHQVGTLKEIANPLPATMLKMISLKRAIEKNKTATQVVNFLKKFYPKDIKEANYRFTGTYREPIESKEGLGLIKVREDGVLKGYYVDPYIAQIFNSSPTGLTNAVLGIFRFLNSSWFRPVYVNLNLGFQTFNIMRDFMRAWKLNPDANIFEILNSYWKSLPLAIRTQWGITPEVVREMREHGMLSFSYNDIFRSEAPEDEKMYEYLLRKYGLLKKEIKNPFERMLSFVEDIGDIIERTPKIAGYLTRLKTGRPIKEIAHEVRNYSGSPDFYTRGTGYDWYNNLFLFANAMKQGLRGDWEGAVINPRTRFAYWWRTAIATFLPKIIMFLGAMGYFGKKIADNYRLQSEYDKTNYTTIPLGFDENEKAIYVRIPQDETGRLLGGIFWKMLNNDYSQQNIAELTGSILGYTGGQLPSISPVAELLANTMLFIGGQAGYDAFRGKPILTEDELLVGGWYRWKKIGRYYASELGLRIPIDLILEVNTLSSMSPIEKITRYTPILGRFLKVSDIGLREEVKEMRKERKKIQAERRLWRREQRGY